MTATTSTMTARTVQAANRAPWRAWLQDNCEGAEEVWLVIQHVRSAKPGIRHGDAIEEAICVGWIDSLARKRDADSWFQRFTPRSRTPSGGVARCGWTGPDGQECGRG